MKFVDTRDMRRFAAEKMQKVNLLETEQMFCDLYCLEPGQSQKRHAHAGEDKVYVVLDGTVRVSVGNDQAALTTASAALALAASCSPRSLLACTVASATVSRRPGFSTSPA